MAKLSCHGSELDRREFPTFRVAVMSDGNIMRNNGTGWKLWKRVKPGIDVVEYAKGARQRYDARPIEFHVYIKALMEATDLEHRWMLHEAISLMPTDPDGVWSEFNDNNQYSGAAIEISEAVAACRAFRALNPNPFR